MGAKANLAFELGESWVIDLVLEGPDGVIAAAAVQDVQFRLIQQGAIAIDLTTDDGVVISGTATATARITVSPSDQVGVKARLQRYETRALLVGGAIHTQAYGSLHVRDSLFAGLGHAPNLIFLSPVLVAALSGPGVWIGDLTALDPDGETSFGWEMVDSLGGRFAIDRDTLVVGPAGLPLATGGTTLEPRVRARDADNNTSTASVPVLVADAGTLSFDLPGQIGLMLALGII